MTRTLPAWDAQAYDANTAHHRVHDAEFLAGYPARPTDHILDLGCGSGDFTETVAARVPQGHVVGLDAEPGMVELAGTRAAANQSFVVGAVQDLDRLFPDDGAFDGITSRAALHWVPDADQRALWRSCRRLLRTGGWLRVDCGGYGNVARVQALLDDVSNGLGGRIAPWNFIDAATAMERLEAAGFTADSGWVRTIAQRRRFSRDELLGWLRSQCYQAYGDGPELARRAELRLDELRRDDGSFDQTFVRLDFLVWVRD
jgi:ubiquinone/menaquinone biosynthesis C-methylase UbiE